MRMICNAKCMRDTEVLQPSPLIKISSRDLGYEPSVIKNLHKLFL
jgi:hypothetical protein